MVIGLIGPPLLQPPGRAGRGQLAEELRALLPPTADQPVEPISGHLFDVVVQDGVVVSPDPVCLP